MSAQLSFFAPAPHVRRHDGFVIQGQERPDDLPRLRESAATMETRVLEWFEAQRARFERTGASEDVAHTPTQCAEALGCDVTSIRPRVSVLSRRSSGPRLEACRWLPRRPTKAGSEGWYRFKGDEDAR